MKHQSFLIAFDAKGKLRWQREIENAILKNDANNFISSIEVDNTRQIYFIIKLQTQQQPIVTQASAPIASSTGLSW
ncbi:MAG: hypothetical protein IPP29_12595 [Bacteroidetes bacterium]|nr:hypothetical protein [Bacteroidota bacterium]